MNSSFSNWFLHILNILMVSDKFFDFFVENAPLQMELHRWCQSAATNLAHLAAPHFFNFVRRHRKTHMARLCRKLGRYTGLPVTKKLVLVI